MAKKAHLDHAQHNHEVCDYLNINGKYSDWTVISSFYAALHFVSHKIFPLTRRTEAGQKFRIETVEEFINIVKKNKPVNKHYVLLDLVYEKCNRDVGHKYRKLLELSKSARYSDYNIEQAVSEKARNLLVEIKEFCK